MTTHALTRWLLPIALLLASSTLFAKDRPPALPEAAQAADVDEHLGRTVDTNIPLVDHEGRSLSLGEVVSGKRPIVLVMAYYRCPMLCGLVLRGVVLGMNELRLSLGKDFDAITVSVDPADTPLAAQQKRAGVLGALGKASSSDWPFLVGSEENVARLADEIGFRYAKDPRSGEYAHPAVTVVLTPGGRVPRYLYGVSPSARDLRLALLEAGEGRIGSIVDRLIMTCYRYDPAARAYGPYVLGFMRIGGALVILTVAATIAALLVRERRAKA